MNLARFADFLQSENLYDMTQRIGRGELTTELHKFPKILLLRDWALFLPIEYKFGLVVLLSNAEGSHNAGFVVVNTICNMFYFSAENNSPAFGCEIERFCLERKAILGKLVFVL
jgi:hypothetical protein